MLQTQRSMLTGELIFFRQIEMETEIDQPLEEVTEACKQLNKAKAKETEMTNQLQDQAQKVRALFMYLCF